VIAQGLATGAGRGYNHVFPGQDGIPGFCLVAVKSRYTQGFQACLKAGVKGVIQFAKDSALMGNAFNMDDLVAVISQIDKVVEKSSGIHQGKFSISELNSSTSG
jgi:hypothetical protein